jgi:hypothetical protein
MLRQVSRSTKRGFGLWPSDEDTGALPCCMPSTGALRLRAQHVFPRGTTDATSTVAHLGAIQAQDLRASLCAVGARTTGVTETDVRAYLDEGRLLRTHLMRGTWQLIAASDIRWLTTLLAPRVIQKNARRYRQLELDDHDFTSAAEIARSCLHGDGDMSRGELKAAFEGKGLDCTGQRLPYLLQRAELDGVLTSGPLRKDEGTWALLDERASADGARADDEAAAELAVRYFASRGPADLHDFAWWSGLPKKDAQHAVDAAAPRLVPAGAGWATPGFDILEDDAGSGALLLPAFDEMLVGYKNRAPILGDGNVTMVNKGGGMISPIVVIDGHAVGTWKRAAKTSHVRVEVDLWDQTADAVSRLEPATKAYEMFLETDVELVVTRRR